MLLPFRSEGCEPIELKVCPYKKDRMCMFKGRYPMTDNPCSDCKSKVKIED